MSLLDRLRPRWRHPDPQVRRGAIKDLTDLDVLDQLAAGDVEPGVRDAAAARIQQVLIGMAIAGDPTDACEVALARLDDEARIATVAMRATHPSIARAALARVGSERLLRDVVREAADGSIREEALARIGDPGVLRSIAVGDGPAELALAALERIDDPDTLAAIAQHRDASARVRRRARELAPAEAAGEPPVHVGEARLRQHELCIELEAFAELWDCEGIEERVREKTAEWQRLAGAVDPRHEMQDRFEHARNAALAAVASWERRRTAETHVEAARDAALAARLALCERAESFDGTEGPGAVAHVRAKWRALDRLEGDDVAVLARRFEDACDAAATRYELHRERVSLLADLDALATHAETLAAATEVPSAKRVKNLVRRWDFRDPAEDTSEEVSGPRARFAQATERLRARREDAERQRHRAQRDNLARLQALAERVDAHLGAETVSLRAAGRDLRTLEAALRDVGPLPPSEQTAAWKARLTVAHEQLLRRYRQEEEAEEWRRFGNATVQEELIGRVEALLASDDLAEATAQLGRIQAEWERVATAPRDRAEALWQRFRTARNALRKRCDAYQAENLTRKQALCDQVALLADSSDWNVTADAIKALQAEWKAIGPVPPRHVQPLFRRFREPCDRFFERRKAHFGRVDTERAENARRKTALCEQAEALADSTDWEQTATVLKGLQAKWKDIGPAPRADTEALWQRFRGACDRFFDRRGRRDELEHEEQVRAAADACAELEAWVAELGGDDDAASDDGSRLVDATWTALRTLEGTSGDDVDTLVARFHAACERLVATRPEGLRGTRVDPEAARTRREKLCARLEALVEVATAPARELTLAERALRLREQLAAKTIGGAADADEQQRADAVAEIARLRAQWKRLGPLLGEDARALDARFVQACARLDGAGARSSTA